MKKAISLLLCLCVAFSLLPTSPAKATNGGSGGATTPEVTELYYAKYVYQMNGELVKQGKIEPLTGNTLSYDIYAAPHLALYSDAAGTTRINSFSFSQTNQAVANLNRTSRGDMFLSVNPLKCGETQVTVALGNKKSFSFNLKIVMPEIGFYTSPERNENNLFKETYFTPGTEKTFYLMKNGGFTLVEANAVAIIENNKKNEVAKLNPEQISGTGKYYVPFKLSADAKDDILFMVSSSNHIASLSLQRNGLRYKYYNKQQAENNTEPTYSPLNLSFGYNLHIVFCYVTDGISKNVSQNELTFPNNISAEMIESGANSYFEISADKIGTGEISYTSVQTSAKMNVTVSLPFLGFYKTQTRDENNYISNNFFFSEGNKSFYLLKDGGFTEQEINNIRFQEGGNMVTHERISKANSQNFDLKLTILDTAQDWFPIIVTVNGPGAGLNCVKATGKVVVEYKIGDGGWQSGPNNEISIQQLPDNTPKEVQIRFKKDGKIVTPTSATVKKLCSPYVTLTGTDGIYTLKFNKLIDLTIDAVFDGTSSSIEVNNWVSTAKNSEFEIDGKKFELCFAEYHSKDNLVFWPIRNASHSFANGTPLKYALAVFEKTTEAGSGNISYKLDMNKTKALSDVAVTPSIDNNHTVTAISTDANDNNWFTTTVADCGTTLFSATATLEGQSYNAYMTIQVNPTKKETIIDLSKETTLTIDQLNTEIASHNESEYSTEIVVKLPAIDITANVEKNVLIGNRNIKLEGSNNKKTGTEYKRTTIHGGLIVNAAWKLNGQITEIQGIKFDGHDTKKARGKGTGISAGGTVRAQPAILGCTFTGFEVGMNTTRLGGLVAYCNFIDNGVGLQIGETLGMERRCCNSFIVNDTAIEILKNTDPDYDTKIGLSTAYIWNFVFIDNIINIKNNVNKPFYMPRALYMKTVEGNQNWTAPLKESFVGDVVFTPYYSTDGLYNTMREEYDGPTKFLGDKLVMNKDTMSTRVEVSAITAAVSNNNPLTMEIMGRSKSNEQELAAKWTFTKDTQGTAGASGRATLLAETMPQVFDPTVTITSSTEIISAEVKLPPTGVKTSLTIPCKTMNSAVVTLNNNVVPSKWDSTSKQVSFDVTEAGTYQISPPISVSETLSGSDRNLSITINLPVTAEATAHVAVYDGSRLIELKTVAVTPTQNTPATANITLDTSKTYKVQVLLLDNATQNPLTDKWSNEYTK